MTDKDGNPVPSTPLEIEFARLAKEAGDRIQIELDAACEALDRAKLIADETGIPFDSPLSVTSNTYWPRKFNEDFKDIDLDLVSDLTGCYSYDSWARDSGGWEKSFC